MKKVFLLLSCLTALQSFGLYSDEDVGYASLLAEKNIIQQQANPDKYNLDKEVLRQEVIAIALKIKGITLPENYTCKKYFNDVTKNDWVCRAIEIAADNGIISRTNKSARAKDTVSQEEATAILMNAKGISYPRNVKINPDIVFYTGKSQWMVDVHKGVELLGVNMPNVGGEWVPRSAIFRTAYQIFSYEAGLSFINCGINNEPQQILLGKSKFDISDFGDLTDCRDTGRGTIFYRDEDKIYVTLGGEISGGGLAVLDIKTMEGKLLGNEHTLSFDGKTIAFLTKNGNWTNDVLNIIEINSGKYFKYELPLINGRVEKISFSRDKNIVGIYAPDFGGDEARVYILNRSIPKTVKHESMSESYDFIFSVTNSGEYSFKKY